MSTLRYVCPLCHARAGELRLDRRGRPYLSCASCASRVFTRGAEQLSCLLSTLRLLDVAENLAWVRTEALTMAARPLVELVRPAAPVMTPVAQAVVGAEQLAMVGGAR